MISKEHKIREAIRSYVKKALHENEPEPDFIKKAKGSTKTYLRKFIEDAEFARMTAPQKVEFIVAMIQLVGLDGSTKQKLRSELMKLTEETDPIPAMPSEEGSTDVARLFDILSTTVIGKRLARLADKSDQVRADAIIKFANLIGVPKSKLSRIIMSFKTEPETPQINAEPTPKATPPSTPAANAKAKTPTKGMPEYSGGPL